MEVSSGISKIRLLLNDPRGEKVCLSDIIEKVSDMSPDAASLEIQNTKAAVARQKRHIKELKTLIDQYKARMSDEVYPEVEYALASRKKGKPRGRQENITEFNEKRKSTNI